MALTMANMKKARQTLRTNHTTPGIQVKGGRSTGAVQPPRNRMAVSAHMRMMATYSPSMNIMYGVEPYSVIKPATSSDSASTMSKGGRLVSASAEMKKMTNIGNSGSQYQLRKVSHGTPSMSARPPASCARTMSVKFSEPTQSSTVMMTKPIETS